MFLEGYFKKWGFNCFPEAERSPLNWKYCQRKQTLTFISAVGPVGLLVVGRLLATQIAGLSYPLPATHTTQTNPFSNNQSTGYQVSIGSQLDTSFASQ